MAFAIAKIGFGGIAVQITERDVRDFFQGTIKLVKEQKVGNELLQRALTKSGEVSKNPNLNGFIAENWHELTFNFNAEAAGSTYRGKALIPEHGYAKNSMDLGIYQNGEGLAVKRYQLKYGSNAETTLRYKNHGDYRGQTLLAPDGQEQQIKGAVNKMTAPDGTQSDPLSKAKAMQMQNEMQNGTFRQCQAMRLVKGAAAEAAKGAVIGGVITASVEAISLYKEYKAGKITGKEYLKEVVKAGGDGAVTGGVTAGLMVPITFGITAVAGAAVASCPLITVPIAFVVGTAVNKIVAPMFGRGDYKKLLGEAKYYQNLMQMNTDLAQSLQNAAVQFEAFVADYTDQLRLHEQLRENNQQLHAMHQKANQFIEQKNAENQQLLTDLGALAAKL